MSQAGRIIYNSINVDLERNWNEAEVVNRQQRASSQSAAGVEEFLNFFDQDFITMVKERITAHELQQLKQWYEYVKDGTAFEFLRDKDLGGFWEFEKTLDNNDLVAATFTRAAGDSGNASYVDPSTGLLTFEDTVDTPRFPAGKWGHAVIIEGSRDNIILNHGMDHADWSKSNITVSADTTEILDPAGGNNADKLTASAANGTVTLTTTVDVGTDDGVFSIWIASPSGDVEGEIRITDGGASVTGTTTFTATPAGEWIQVPYTNAGDPGDNWVFVIQIDTNTEVIYVYGPQGEAGADILFASSYIRGDLSSELMPNQVDRDFSGASAWANVDLDSYDETGDLSISSDVAAQYCTCPVASAPTTIGEHYKMTFTVANLTSTWTIKSFDNAQTIGTVTGNGAQSFTWKATTTGGYRIVAVGTVSVGDFDDFTLQRITKTRNTETLRIVPTNIVGNSKGTIAFWFKPKMQVFDDLVNTWLYEHGDSGGGDRHSRITWSAAGALGGGVNDVLGNENSAVTFSLTSAFTANAWAHIAMTYDTTISNGVKLYYDGVLVDTSTNDAFIPMAEQDFFHIGANRSGNFPAHGVFDDFLIRKDALTASQIKRIYNMGRGLGEPRNRWANVILNNPEFIERYLRGINRFNFEISMREKIT